MTIYGEIVDLQNYLKSKVGLNVRLGMVDVSANEYPIILIIPNDGVMKTLPQQDRFFTCDFDIKIKLIDAKNDVGIIRTLQNADKLLTVINNFGGGKGNIVKPDITTEYTDNTWELTIGYSLRLRYHNS